MRPIWHIVAHATLALACGAEDSGETPGGVEPVRHECLQGSIGFSPPHEIPKAHVKESYSGTNGTFTDTCQGGVLVQYGCAEVSTAPHPSDPGTYTYTTGAVTHRNVDCDGRCVDGACPNICPNVGDEFRYLSVEADGRATLESVSSGWTYACDVNPSGGCTAAPKPGDIEKVISATTPGTWAGDECTADMGMALGAEMGPSCWYHPCVVIPD